MRTASLVLTRPPDDLPEARVWRPELVPVTIDLRPGLPVQPALFPMPRRTTGARTGGDRPFVDLLDAASLDAGPADASGPARRRGPGTVQVSLVGAAPSRRLPDVRRWSVNLGVALVEVVLGHRALAQLIRWLDDDALRVLGLTASTTREHRSAGLRTRIALASARVQILDPETVEVCLHATQAGDRVVVAFRLQAVTDRWLCTQLDLLTQRVRGRRLVD